MRAAHVTLTSSTPPARMHALVRHGNWSPGPWRYVIRIVLSTHSRIRSESGIHRFLAAHAPFGLYCRWTVTSLCRVTIRSPTTSSSPSNSVRSWVSQKAETGNPKPQPPSPDSPQAQTVTLSRQFSTLGESSPNRTRASALGGLPGAAPVDSRARSGDLACSKWGGGDSTAVGNVASDIADSPSGAARARQRFRKAVWSGGRPSRKPRHRATRTGHRWRRGQRCQSLRGISHVRYQLQPVLKRDLQLQPDAKSLACMGLMVPKACRLRGPSDANHAAILDCFES